jgi:hypothetical protein
VSGNIFVNRNIVFNETVKSHFELLSELLDGKKDKGVEDRRKIMYKELFLSLELISLIERSVEEEDYDFLKAFRLCLYSRSLLGIYDNQFGIYRVDDDTYCRVVYAISLYANQNSSKYRKISTGMFYGQGKYDCGYMCEGTNWKSKHPCVDPVFFVREMLDMGYKEVEKQEEEDKHVEVDVVDMNVDIGEIVCPIEEEKIITEYDVLFYSSRVQEVISGVETDLVGYYEYEIAKVDYEGLRKDQNARQDISLVNGNAHVGVRIQLEIELEYTRSTERYVLCKQKDYLGKKILFVEKDYYHEGSVRLVSYVAGSYVYGLYGGQMFRRRPPEIVKLWCKHELRTFKVRAVVFARYRDKGRFMLCKPIDEWIGLYQELGEHYFEIVSRLKGAECPRNYSVHLKSIVKSRIRKEYVTYSHFLESLFSSQGLVMYKHGCKYDDTYRDNVANMSVLSYMQCLQLPLRIVGCGK